MFRLSFYLLQRNQKKSLKQTLSRDETDIPMSSELTSRFHEAQSKRAWLTKTPDAVPGISGSKRVRDRKAKEASEAAASKKQRTLEGFVQKGPRNENMVAMVNHRDAPVPSTCDFRRMKLKCKYPLGPQDDEVLFDEGPHKYYIYDPEKRVWVKWHVSGTGFVGSLAPHFDRWSAASKKVKGRKWRGYTDFKGVKHPPEHEQEKYLALINEHGVKDVFGFEMEKALVSFWEKDGRKASAQGTDGHNQIELRINEEPHHKDAPGFNHYISYERDLKENQLKTPQGFLHPTLNDYFIVPYRTEATLFSRTFKLVGTIDMLYGIWDTASDDFKRDPSTGKPLLVMVDWKFTRRLLSDHNKMADPSFPFKKYLKEPFQEELATRKHKYFLQLNLYSEILEREYGYRVLSCHLAVFHKDQRSYQIVDVPDWRSRIRTALEVREADLKRSVFRMAEREGWVFSKRHHLENSCEGSKGCDHVKVKCTKREGSDEFLVTCNNESCDMSAVCMQINKD